MRNVWSMKSPSCCPWCHSLQQAKPTRHGCIIFSKNWNAAVSLKVTKTGALPSLHPVTANIQENAFDYEAAPHSGLQRTTMFIKSLAFQFTFPSWSLHSRCRWVYSLEAECFGLFYLLWASSWWTRSEGNRTLWLFSNQTDTFPVLSSPLLF